MMGNTVWELLRAFAAERWLPWAADTAARSLLLLALCAFVLFLLRRSSAANRHLALVFTCGSLLLLPLLPLLVPPWTVVVPPATVAPFANRGGGERRPLSAAPGTELSQAHRPAPPPAGAATEEAGLRRSRPANAAAVLFPAVLAGGWLAGVLLLVVREAAALLGLARLGRQRPGMTAGRVPELAHALAREMGVRRRVSVLAGAPGDVPLTWGHRRPVLLLPVGAGDWPEPRLRAVLLHELAHVARGDWLVQLLARLVRALYWPNPLAWRLARRIEREAEVACDDRVLGAGISPVAYAHALLEVLRMMKTMNSARGGHDAAVAAIARRHPTRVRERLQAILDARQVRTAMPGPTGAAALLAAAGALLLVSALRPAQVQADVGAPPATTISATATAKVELPGRVTVQLLRVMDRTPAGDLRAWRPDGSPLAEKRYGYHLPRDSGERAVYASIASCTPREVSHVWEEPDVREVPAWSSGGGQDKGMVATYFARRFPPGQRRATFRLAVAAEPWRTVLAVPSGRRAAARVGNAYPVALEPGGSAALRTPGDAAAAPNGPRRVRLDHGLRAVMKLPSGRAWRRAYEFRLLAVDATGQAHPLDWIASDADRAGKGPITAEFGAKGFTLNRRILRRRVGGRGVPEAPVVTELRFEVRPWRWVEFRDVALEPEPRASAVDGPRVIVTLRDGVPLPARKRSESRDAYVRNVNRYLVKDADVLAVLDALEAAGAEAVAVGGRRVAAATQVRAMGPMLLVDGMPVSASPAIIEAVGDPDRLAAALEGPRGLQVRYQGRNAVMFSVRKAARLTLPAR